MIKEQTVDTAIIDVPVRVRAFRDPEFRRLPRKYRASPEDFLEKAYETIARDERDGLRHDVAI